MEQYSTSSLNKHTFKILKPFEYQSWSKEEVCSFLHIEAALTYETINCIYHSDFDGTCLDTIVSYITNFGVEKTITLSSKDFPCLSERTVSNIVYWVENLLKTRLYHLWSIEQIQEYLLQEGKYGLLRNIETLLNACLLERIIKGDKDAFESLSEKDMNLLCAWKESFNISIRILYQERNMIPHSIIAARTDPKFEYLRDLKNNPIKWQELESKIGQNIEIPIIDELGSRFLPKNYRPKSPYILTKQSFDILKGVVTRQQDGFVLSGPFGISKSYIMLLIAVYAIVNSLPFLYAPLFGLCVVYQRKNKDFLKESVLFYNSDILSKAQLIQLKRTDNVMTFLKCISTEFDSLYYLFDEHHEIYMTQDENYFKLFTDWNFSCEKSVTIYSGSAHSKFEDNLPKEAISRIIRIIPPTFSEFYTFVQNFGFGNLDEESLIKLEYATGRIPGEISLFSYWYPQKFTDKDIRNFTSRRSSEYYQRLMQKFKECENRKFTTTIHNLFNVIFRSDSELTNRNIQIEGPLYDLGLLFKNSDNLAFPINEAAKRALFSFYIAHYNVIDESNTLEIESSFKRQFIFNEFEKSHIHDRFLLSDGTSAVIKYTINSHSSLDLSTMDCVRSLCRKRWLEGDSILFIPKSQFPVLDYFIVSYGRNKIQIVLKKVIYTANEQDESNSLELFRPVYLIGENQIYCEMPFFQIKERGLKVTREYTYSLFELIVHSILDNYNVCNTVELQVESHDNQDNETKLIELRKKAFNFMSPTTRRSLSKFESEWI